MHVTTLFKSICHYDTSLSLALPLSLIIFIRLPIGLSGLVGRETVSEIKFCSSVLVERKRRWFYISPLPPVEWSLWLLRKTIKTSGCPGLSPGCGWSFSCWCRLALPFTVCCFHLLKFTRCRPSFARIPREIYNLNHCPVGMLPFWPKKSYRFRMRAVTIMPVAKWLLTRLLWRQALHFGSESCD